MPSQAYWNDPFLAALRGAERLESKINELKLRYNKMARFLSYRTRMTFVEYVDPPFTTKYGGYDEYLLSIVKDPEYEKLRMVNAKVRMLVLWKMCLFNDIRELKEKVQKTLDSQKARQQIPKGRSGGVQG